MKKIIYISVLIISVLFACNNAKTIEKDGGLRINISINCVDLLDQIAFSSGDSLLQLSLQKTAATNPANLDEMLRNFSNAVLEYNPSASLAGYFISLEYKDVITFNSTNEQVIAALKSILQKRIDNTLKNIAKRIELLTDQPINIKTLNFNSFQVEIPGSYDNQRISNYLQSSGSLDFWETYENAEIFNYLNDANKLLLELGYNASPKTADLSQNSSSLVNEINEQKNNDTNQYVQNNPLFTVLMPSTQSGSKLSPGPCIGRSWPKDTATVNQFLNIHAIKSIFPRDLKFYWSAKPYQDTEIYELIAIKVSQRDGTAPITGEFISNASAEPDKYSGGSVINITMNTEGARIWERMTSENINRAVAIVFDGKVYSYPIVMTEIKGGKSSISGNFTTAEAQDIANIINAGKYQANIKITSVEQIAPANK